MHIDRSARRLLVLRTALPTPKGLVIAKFSLHGGNQFMIITVYGAETPCPSCLHSPSSRETMEWLDAAIRRKFPDNDITIRYIDIYHSITEEDADFTTKIINDEYFYPLVVANGHVIGEGDPKLKTIFSYIEKQGYKSA